jgi:hypothetical protein
MIVRFEQVNQRGESSLSGPWSFGPLSVVGPPVPRAPVFFECAGWSPLAPQARVSEPRTTDY